MASQQASLRIERGIGELRELDAHLAQAAVRCTIALRHPAAFVALVERRSC